MLVELGLFIDEACFVSDVSDDLRISACLFCEVWKAFAAAVAELKFKF